MRLPSGMFTEWAKGLDSEFGYWWWQIKNAAVIRKGELFGRDSPLAPFDSFVESLVETCGPDGVVKILDVGAGPLSPLGEMTLAFVLAVVAIDALAVAFNEALDERVIGIGSPLRSRQGFAERLHELFEPASFDGVVCWNALDHMADPFVALQEMAKVVRPGGFIHVKCWRNEGAHENWQGLHQWNVDFEGGIPVILGSDGRKFVVPDAFPGWKLDATLTNGGSKPEVRFLARRPR